MNKQELLNELELKMIQSYPVVLALSTDGKNITLHTIAVERTQRNVGTGTAILRSICEFADMNGLSITLTPDSSLGGNLKKLHKFYKRFGFVKYTEYYYSDSHIRYPKGQS